VDLALGGGWTLLLRFGHRLSIARDCDIEADHLRLDLASTRAADRVASGVPGTLVHGGLACGQAKLARSRYYTRV
jgi:hypothetical protein